MFKLFKRSDINYEFGNQRFAINLSHLREDERLEFKYDKNNNLVAVQKVKLSLLEEPIEAVAETDIETNGVGRVFYQGTYWKAICDGDKVLAGQKVLVKAKHNLTLLVIPSA